MDDWRVPYRSQDAGGSAEAAGSVAWDWIEAVARGQAEHRQELSIHSDAGSVILYRGTTPIAVATVFRDPMNFAVLIRWAANGVAE